MASTVTQFPPPTYSSYFLRSILKEVISSKPLNGLTGKKAATAAALCEDALSAGERALDFGEFLKSRSRSSQSEKKKTPSPTSTGFKKWRKLKGGKSSSDAEGEVATESENGCNHKSPSAPGRKDQSSADEDMSYLQLFALNALDLSVPASDVLLKNRQNNWFQLAGHRGCFAPAGPGTIWKKRNGPDNTERTAYEALCSDPLARDIIPHYYREVEYQGEKFIELQDLLYNFKDPNVIDIKMGIRTFLESEVQKTTGRSDLYKKMVQVDPSAPTAEEHRLKAVTKLRYMQFREQQSSTCSQGFRIEAMKFRGSAPVTDLKKIKSREEVMATIALFLGGREDVRQRMLTRLVEIRSKFEQSSYFQTHEIVGSSIFMIYDDEKVGAWVIDFAKTHPVPQNSKVDHRKPWVQGNQEEGFLFGLDNLIKDFEEVDLSSRPSRDSLRSFASLGGDS